MLSALYFWYDGVYSGTYGLQILDLNGSNIENSSIGTLNVKTVKASRQKAFVYNGVLLSNPPTHQFQIISQTPLLDTVRREVLAWLLGRGEFKKLIINQPDLADYYFNCIFSNIDIIYINGSCYGFELTATFDSMYAYGSSKVYEVTGSGTAQTISVVNDSDIADDYVYPTLTIKTTGNLSSTDSSGSYKAVSIYNTSDDTTREFYFVGLSSGVQYTVDNELKIISPNSNSNLLGNFSKKWLRLRQGTNTLKITVNGTVTITVPQYVLIGL